MDRMNHNQEDQREAFQEYPREVRDRVTVRERKREEKERERERQ